MVLQESVRTELMRTNAQFCGIVTFAILSHLSVSLDEGKHLGENHQKRAIPAAYVAYRLRRHQLEGLLFEPAPLTRTLL
jgi:hypothetical protein